MNTKKLFFKIYIIPILLVAMLTALDQLTKYIVKTGFWLGESRPVIKDVFHFTYVQNEGMAFGAFQGARIAFLVITILMVLGCMYLFINTYGIKKYLPIDIGLLFLMAGAIGNMIDRVKLSYVIDFLDFKLINFPVFNVADIYVTCSIIYFAILFIFKYSDDEINEIFSLKSKNTSSVSDEESEISEDDE